MLIEVEGHSGERVSAAIFPIALEDNAVVGAVEWDCAELWASIVRVDFETAPGPASAADMDRPGG
ncbi:hypothetical protein [Paracidovorax valerianellae]|nr:hypothetical protein [Paracidovorax valerianellae]MDA8447329.1 hypothetical protein [Paracidovorax valerianellae]